MISRCPIGKRRHFGIYDIMKKMKVVRIDIKEKVKGVCLGKFTYRNMLLSGVIFKSIFCTNLL